MAHTQRLPDPLAESWDWQRRAACRGLDSTAFFHPAGERGQPWRRREERARQVCAGCPVREECLAHSLRVEEPYGVWGGVGERERWQLVRQRRATRRDPSATPVRAAVVAVAPDMGSTPERVITKR